MTTETPDIAAIEKVLADSWPAERVEPLGGWTMRFNEGYSRRANSVITDTDPGMDVDEAIERVEARYRSYRLPPAFAISPITQPADLDQRLAAKGYRAEGHSIVMMSPGASMLVHTPWVNISISAHASELWSRRAFEGMDTNGRAARLGIVRRIEPPAAYATAEMYGEIAATGVAVGRQVGHTRVVALHSLSTSKRLRGKGAGKAVLAALGRWALSFEKSMLILQVERGNTAAMSLYMRFGFRPLYKYHYRFLRQQPSVTESVPSRQEALPP